MELAEDPALEAGYATLQRVWETCGVAATAATGTWLALRLVDAAIPTWWFPLALVVGIAGADLVSGVVHWTFDTWGDRETPFFGPLVIRAFRAHHLAPGALLAHDFIETNGHNFLLALALTVSGLRLAHAHAFVALSLLAMAVFVAFTNQIHKWAHMARPPMIVRWLQRARLVLPGDHHARHHRAPFLQNYCITAGWLDALLRITGTFARIERLVTWATGARPRRHPS
jgi:ubiquitin-conjugating enzyme E2 variant